MTDHTHTAMWENKALQVMARRQERELRAAKRAYEAQTQQGARQVRKQVYEESNKETAEQLAALRQADTEAAASNKTDKVQEIAGARSEARRAAAEQQFQNGIQRHEKKKQSEKELRAAYNRIAALESAMAEMTALTKGSPTRTGTRPKTSQQLAGSPRRGAASPRSPVHCGSPRTGQADASVLSEGDRAVRYLAQVQVESDRPFVKTALKWK
eukprot:Rhum_TRINITY_DN4562_c0_g1::Rhum_TRINITY_DN4562_c0_g1_i1::g.14838::m.14838